MTTFHLNEMSKNKKIQMPKEKDKIIKIITNLLAS
mgnify:CR=1 FL=1